jgi:hypothetical protein
VQGPIFELKPDTTPSVRAVSERGAAAGDRDARMRAALGNQAMLRQHPAPPQTRSDRAGDPAPASVRSALRRAGRPLDGGVRAAMEAAFCTDLSAVRVHDDPEAASSARAVGARAYTVGRHIAFAAGAYRPEDGAGRRLLAHELGHVLQQGDADVEGPITLGATGTPAEREAEAAGDRALAGSAVRAPSHRAGVASPTAPVLRRQVDPFAMVMGKGEFPGSPTLDGQPIADKGVSTELSDSPPGSSSAERVFKWLQAHALEIGWMEWLYGVDRLAIAGAIAWEALRNPRPFVEELFGRFLGAGKPHVRAAKYGLPAVVSAGENVPEEVEQAGLLPHRSVLEREGILAADSIPYIAAGMRLAVDIAAAYGFDIATDPAMLTWFWVSKDANSFIAHLAKKQDRTFEPTKEEMPRWVMENLRWLTLAVGESHLRPVQPGAAAGGGPARLKLGTMETASWKGSYQLDTRLPETREFLVNGGKVALTISAFSVLRGGTPGTPVYVVLHRREAGSDVAVGDAKEFTIDTTATLTWSDLPDGLYFFEIFNYNGPPIEGDMAVSLTPRAALPEAANQPAPAVLQRTPDDVRDAGASDAGITDAGVKDPGSRDAGAPDAGLEEGTLRANAARELVRQLEAKKAVYGHELDPTGSQRTAGWWWEETEFDSKFVLWVLAGRQVGDPPLAAQGVADRAIRDISAPPLGRVSDASSVSAMIAIVERLVAEGKTTAIEDRVPKVGDVMFWGGHAAIVVEVQPVDGGDTWVVYANMGVTGARLEGKDAKDHYWLKASQVAANRALGVGGFKGYWSP